MHNSRLEYSHNGARNAIVSLYQFSGGGWRKDAG